MGRAALVSVALLAALALVAPASVAAATTAGTTGGDTVTLVGAGDIAVCDTDFDAQTAALVQAVLDNDPTAIAFTAGDNVYPNGSTQYFTDCYEPTWGAFKARTRPALGNHEYYKNPGAAGYFEYFGSLAGPDGRGWYKFSPGSWRVYVLTSECKADSRCYRQQLKWLKADLSDNPHECVMAIWHRPLFSTGEHGNAGRMRELFDVLYDAGAELVVNGHDHGYQRWAPMDALGAADATTGIREIVAAIGGAPLYDFPTDNALVAYRNNTDHGVLKLTLAPGSYSWEFEATPDGTVLDSGSDSCH
jgi:hypothetical protein